uniref:Uncharacterized protein n=1 Tax=Cucumis melo TaxID=3656 RepID=A0A9I9EAW3_CUCME
MTARATVARVDIFSSLRFVGQAFLFLFLFCVDSVTKISGAPLTPNTIPNESLMASEALLTPNVILDESLVTLEAILTPNAMQEMLKMWSCFPTTLSRRSGCKKLANDDSYTSYPIPNTSSEGQANLSVPILFNSLPLVLVELADYAYEKSLEVDIEPIDIINHIKERVEEKEGIPPVQQSCAADFFGSPSRPQLVALVAQVR